MCWCVFYLQLLNLRLFCTEDVFPYWILHEIFYNSINREMNANIDTVTLLGLTQEIAGTG